MSKDMRDWPRANLGVATDLFNGFSVLLCITILERYPLNT